MTNRSMCIGVLSLAVLGAASQAHAQEVVVGASAGGGARQGEVRVGIAPAPVVVTRAETPDPVRFRFGIALDGDLLASPSLIGLGAGLTVRLGVQFNEWFGVYYQPHGIAGAWLTDSAGGVIASLFNSVLAELTLPFFHVGVGPSVDVLAVAGCSGNGCLAGDAVYFGLDSRIALVLGAIGRGSRGGFSINLHVHPTFTPDDVVTTIALGVGGEVY